MADWSLLGDGQRFESIGADTANSRGTTLTAGNPASTEGSWAELIASTTFDITELRLQILPQNTFRAYLIDIGIGAGGSEVVLVPNLYVDWTQGIGTVVHLNLSIPAGTRIAARCQCDSASSIVRVAGQVIGKGFLPSSPLAKFTAYGVDTGTSLGTVIDPGGVAHTKGAWSEITASTTSDIRQLTVSIGINANAAPANGEFLFDIAIGAGGSEQVLLPNLGIWATGTGDYFTPVFYPSIDINIPTETRIAGRAQSTITDATDRLFTIGLVGAG